jgi:hypothetical protein
VFFQLDQVQQHESTKFNLLFHPDSAFSSLHLKSYEDLKIFLTNAFISEVYPIFEHIILKMQTAQYFLNQ